MAAKKTTTTKKTTTAKATASTAKAKTVSGGSNPKGLTTSQVKSIQTKAGLKADGIIGPKTQAVLNKQNTTSSSSSSKSSSSSSSSKSSGSSSSSNTKNAIMDLQRTLNSKGANIAVDGVMGPKTQAALNSYNSSVSKGGGGSGSGSTTKATGIDTINKTLNFGSSDPQVKELQNYLANTMGYTNADGTPLKTDGGFGANTKAAVMKFQKAHGLTVDGIVGPQTLAKMKSLAGTGEQANNDFIYDTGNEEENGALKGIYDMLTKQQNEGLQLNPDLIFDQATLDRFLSTAQSQVAPIYAQKIEEVKQDVLRTAPQVLQNYDAQIADAEASFQNNLGNAREGWSDTGMAFSGGRAAGEQGLLASQNRSLSNLGQEYANKLYTLGSGAEKQIGTAGMSGFNIPSSLSSYSASLGGLKGGLSTSGSISGYTPGTFGVGSLQSEEAAAKEKRYQDLLQTASNSVLAGRSYNDLFA